MSFDIKVDDDDWEARIDQWVPLASEAGRRASEEGAHEIKHAAQALLTAVSHVAGTRTPSPPGSPPAMISGALAGSLAVDMDADGVASVGPTDVARSFNGPYGRFLELGGIHEGHMHWTEDGQEHFATVLYKHGRPYLEPATTEVVDSGRLTRIYERHWAEAQAEVTR